MDVAKEEFSTESATYLWVAETVIRTQRRPLTANQIVSFALEKGLFGDKALSRTPQKSMQARLSIDILSKGESSRFLRTQRGRFFLRSILHNNSLPTTQSETIAEYTAVRRAPAPPSELVLVVPKSAYADVLTFQGINTDYDGILSRLRDTGALTYVPRTEAETNSSYKQFVTYTVIQQRDRILSFRRGNYNRAASFLRGAMCIGFGGHVTEDDIDIFSYGDHGIKANAAREISEEVKLSTGRPEIDPREIEVLGFLNDDSSDVGVRHVAAVLRYWVPETEVWKKPQRGEASVARVGWLKTASPGTNLLEFEYWSQLLLRTFFPAVLASRPSFKIVREQLFKDPHLLCVTGSIGSGKSVTTERFCNSAGYRQINTGAVLAKILGVPPVPDTPRDLFQKLAHEFIMRPDGPTRLASAILAEASAMQHPRIIVDGLRQLQTIERLKELSSQRVATLFVHTPPDIAYRFYMLREARQPDVSLADFMKIYNAPVETEVSLFIEQADAIIYNWFGLDQYEAVIQQLLKRLGLMQCN